MRVRVGSKYRYERAGYDLFDSKAAEIAPGSVVKVINLPGAPPANTMGHCYVADPVTGDFLGMVDTLSLTPLR